MARTIKVELTPVQAEKALEMFGFAMAGEGPGEWTATDWKVAERVQAAVLDALRKESQ